MTVESVAFGMDAGADVRRRLGPVITGLIDGSLGPFRHSGSPDELVTIDAYGYEKASTAGPTLFDEIADAFAASEDRLLFLAMQGEAFGKKAVVTVKAVAQAQWYEDEPAGPAQPGVLDIGMKVHLGPMGVPAASYEARDAIFEWGSSLLESLAQLHDPVVGRVAVGTGITWWERHRDGPVRARDEYYWVSPEKVLSPDWCLLLNDAHVEQLGGLAAVKSEAYSVADVVTPSGELFLVKATESLSAIADDEQLQQSWIRFLRPILW